MPDTLKPCPFCGRKPDVLGRPETPNLGLAEAVIRCTCPIGPSISMCAVGSDKAQQIAEELWNRRTSPEVERLVEALNRFAVHLDEVASPFGPPMHRLIDDFTQTKQGEV